MAGRTPAHTSSWQDKFPPSPLGATPRPHLRQVYPKVSDDAFLSEYQHSSKQTSYTSRRSHNSSLDVVDMAKVVDYSKLPEDDLPASMDVGGSTKSIIILALIFFLALVAVGLVYVGLGPK